MQGTKVIRVYNEGLKKLDRINSERPQDVSRADTFEYVLIVFEESPLRVTEKNHPFQKSTTPGSASPIIDADNLRIVTPTTLAEKLYADKQRKTAQDLIDADNAPTKNNTCQESKE